MNLKFFFKQCVTSTLCLTIFIICFTIRPASALEVNNDGSTLIQESEQTFQKDMNRRPVLKDKKINGYVKTIINRLIPANHSLPSGVIQAVTILESPQPQLYSYTSGHIVLTTGTLFAMDNEAQLAGVLSREVANIAEGYYIGMYQEIKAAQRNQQRKEVAAALMGSLMDVAVDFSVKYASYEIDDDWYRGEETYKRTRQKLAGIYAAKSAYYGIKDVIESIPKKDEKGQWVDPRLRIEPVADAKGMIYLTNAGYDCNEAALGWDNLFSVKNKLLQESEASLGPWADQIRQSQKLMQMNLDRMRRSIGSTGLLQTRGDIPQGRSDFVANLVKLTEVRQAQKGKTLSKGVEKFFQFLRESFIPRAQKEMDDENYEIAYAQYKELWNKGIQTAPISYGIAKSKLGDFAFGASEAEKKEAEKAFKKAAELDKTFALTYKGLGELYEDWERYEDAANVYQTYIKLKPDADDKKRIKRKIKMCKRKADR